MENSMRVVIYFALVSASLCQSLAQNTTIDSLSKVLKSDNQSDSATIATMIELSYAYAQIVPDSSYALASRALELARDKKIRILEAWSLNRLSGYYWLTARFPEAIKAAQESLQIFEDLGDVKGIADGYNVLANTYAMDNDLERALTYYKKSLAIFEKLGDTDALSRGLSNVGRVNYMLGRYDSALVYMEAIKEIVLGTNTIRESIMYNTTGDIYQKLGQPRLALDYYEKGLKIAEALNSQRIITYSTRGMAEVYQMLGDVSSSNRYALLTLRISEEIDYLENVRNATKILSDNFRSMGDFENAYNYFVKYSATKDTMFNSEKSREIEKLEENFKIKEQEKEIALLTAEQQLQTQRSNQQKIGMIALVTIISLVIILVIVQFRKIRLKQQTNLLLTEQARLLEEANQTKDKLFSVISHDLKSPFGALLMVTEQLDQQTFSQEELRSLKNSLQGRVQSLNELLNNLLYWSKSQMKGVTQKKEAFDLTEVIARNIKVFKQVADEKQIHLTSNVTERHQVYADNNEIDCVIRNLINNALKFTNANGTVTVSLTSMPNKTMVSVEDTGTGISDDIMASLFTSESKMRMTGTNNEVGSGLGLFLCKEFTEKNGGTLDVETELGKGSRFYFTIPNQEAAS
jgi:signal transduction histidine kinase